MVKKIISNKEVLDELDSFLNELDSSRSNKTKYWIKDYIRFQREEIKISKTKNKGYKKYNRGDIIKAHFGFRVGREFGGLHYAVVIGGFENRNNHTLTVVPLKSAKIGVNTDFLPNNQLYLGHDIYEAINDKIKIHEQNVKDLETLFISKTATLENIKGNLKELEIVIKNLRDDFTHEDKQTTEEYNIKLDKASNIFLNVITSLNNDLLEIWEKCKELGVLKSNNAFQLVDISPSSVQKIMDTINIIKKAISKEFEYISNLIKENDRMKENGSIAIINQITTISKIRIYDPKTSIDALNNISISKENLIKIEREITKMLAL